RILDVDTRSYLPEDLAVKMEVACMANSLQSRSPLLDHRIMEFAAALPGSYKLKPGSRGMVSKYIFKKAMESILPADILYRPKRGFGVPIDHWLRFELKEMAYDILLSRRARDRGYVNPSYVRQLLDEHVAGVANHHYQIWSLLFLELW